MKPGLRPSMTWLHDWSGLVIGWVLFAIALAGTLSVFRDEIGDWARPEARCCATDSAASGAAAIHWLARQAPKASAWYILPAGPRSSTSYAVYADPQAGFIQRWVDARGGSPAGIRDTLGGDFFYRLHFELQLPYPWGRILAGCAALVMLLALLTGIVAHKRIFVDFFTFRPAKKQRSWLDAHNMLAVAPLPFHLMISFTGALTLSTLLMPWGGLSAFRGDSAALYHALDPAAVQRTAVGRPAPLAPIEPMLRQAEARFGGGLMSVNVFNPGDANAVVTVTRAEDARIGVQAATLSFDGATGRLLASHDERRPALATYKFLYGLHTVRFGDLLIRWIYFLCGLALTAMIGAGLLLWSAKRRERRQDFGTRLVERLNIGFVAGTPIAFAAFFVANRLLPVDLPGRADVEVRVVFWTWGALLVFAALRTPARAWREVAALGATMLLAIPVSDFASGSAGWNAVTLGVDGIACFGAALFASLAAHLYRRRAPAAVRVRETVAA